MTHDDEPHRPHPISDPGLRRVCHDCRGGTRVHGFASALSARDHDLKTTYWPRVCATCECTGWLPGLISPT